jgi:hypothetical protein
MMAWNSVRYDTIGPEGAMYSVVINQPEPLNVERHRARPATQGALTQGVWELGD